VSISIEHGDLDRYVLDLDEALAGALPKVREVVQKGALNIKRDAQRRVGGLAHAPSYPAAISYDTTVGAGGVYAEIGPDKGRRQGALGNLIEYGSVNNAPIPHIAPAVDEELPRFERAMEDLAEKLLQ
jgi:hypothetical protein